MATTAAVYYAMQPTSSTTLSFSSLSPDVSSKFTDGPVGDTSTGYTVGPQSGMSNFNVVAGYDFGVPTAITGWEVAASTNGGGGTVLYGSNDGVGWTVVSQVGGPRGTSGKLTTTAPGNGVAISATYRYYEMSVQGGGGTGSVFAAMTDARMYDSAGAVVVAGALNTSTPRNLTTVIIY